MKKAQQAKTVIQNCTFQNGTINLTPSAIVALAMAAQANAEAISAIANASKGSNASMISVGADNAERP